MLYKNRSLLAVASLVVAAAVPQLAQADILTYSMNFDTGLANGNEVGETYGNLGAGQGFHFLQGAVVNNPSDPANSGNVFGTVPSPSNILTFDCAINAPQCNGISFTSNTDIVGIDFEYFIVGGFSLSMMVSGTDANGHLVNCPLSQSLTQTTPSSWQLSSTNCSNKGSGLRSVTFFGAAGTFGLDDITVRTQSVPTGGGGGNLPEPASLVLAGLGLAGLLASRHSKQV